MKKRELQEVVKNIVKEIKTLREEDMSGAMTPQEKLARRKLEQTKIELARANQMASQKNLSQIR